jgi:two-component system, cell cycle sensor histidine kinase and response regulator CckA
MEASAKPLSENLGTILLVEDDEALSYAISRHLKSEGYTVIVTSGSMAALRELDNGAIDITIAVIDVSLQPGEPHGIALARMIALNSPAVAVLFVTGRKDLIEIAGGIPGDVLYKPIELNELAQKVRELVGPARR